MDSRPDADMMEFVNEVSEALKNEDTDCAGDGTLHESIDIFSKAIEDDLRDTQKTEKPIAAGQNSPPANEEEKAEASVEAGQAASVNETQPTEVPEVFEDNNAPSTASEVNDDDQKKINAAEIGNGIVAPQNLLAGLPKVVDAVADPEVDIEDSEATVPFVNSEEPKSEDVTDSQNENAEKNKLEQIANTDAEFAPMKHEQKKKESTPCSPPEPAPGPPSPPPAPAPVSPEVPKQMLPSKQKVQTTSDSDDTYSEFKSRIQQQERGVAAHQKRFLEIGSELLILI